MDKAIEIVEGPKERVSERWLTLLWASPWVLILGWCIWHFSRLSVDYIRARLDWAREQRDLSVAYAKMNEDSQRGDFDSYILSAGAANGALVDLKSTLRRLSGATGQYGRERFLQRAEDCVSNAGFAVTPPQAKRSDFCVHLIDSGKS